MKPLNASIHLATASALALSASAMGAPQESEPIAQINRIDGLVMISQGSRYIDAREGMDLRALDRLLVLEDASVLLKFSDGCQMTLDEASLLNIAGPETCASAIEQAATSQLGSTPASGTTTSAGAGTAGSGAGAAGAGAGAAGVGAGAGAAAAGGGALAGIGGLGLAGTIGVGVAAVGAAGFAVAEASSSNNGNDDPQPISQ